MTQSLLSRPENENVPRTLCGECGRQFRLVFAPPRGHVTRQCWKGCERQIWAHKGEQACTGMVVGDRRI